MSAATKIRPPCHTRLPTETFQLATEEDIDRLDPCGYCFPDGECDLPIEDLVVAGEAGRNSSYHRRESTGELAGNDQYLELLARADELRQGANATLGRMSEHVADFHDMEADD